ncbi:MAG: ERV1/ALR-related protein [Flavobacterium sp.]
MSPPEVWGPAVWTLFHTLIEHLDANAYPHVVQSLYHMIVRICQVLPCPDCSRDASLFLAKINLRDYKTKDEFKTMLYLFHNWVNAKKRKPLYNYSDLHRYASMDLKWVIHNFINKYHTKGNMKLLADSFQRQFVVRDFFAWFKHYIRAFMRPIPEKTIAEESIHVEEKTAIEESVNVEEKTAIEEGITLIIEELINVEEKTVIEELINVEEKTAIEESINVEEKTAIEELINVEEKTASEEGIALIIEEKPASKKKRSHKSKK